MISASKSTLSLKKSQDFKVQSYKKTLQICVRSFVNSHPKLYEIGIGFWFALLQFKIFFFLNNLIYLDNYLF